MNLTMGLFLIIVFMVAILSVIITILFCRRSAGSSNFVKQKRLVGTGMPVQSEVGVDHISSLKNRVAKEVAIRASKSNMDLLVKVLDEVRRELAFGGLGSKSNQLSDLVDGAMEIATFESMRMLEKKDHVFVNEFCLQVFNECLVGASESLDVVFETSLSDDFSICTNVKALEKVLSYLILCSITYTKKGFIRLDTYCDEQSRCLVFKVVDSGVGVPEEDKKAIFEMLSNGELQNKITGIRLRVCRVLVRLLGGNIYIESNHENGTSVMFTTKF